MIAVIEVSRMSNTAENPQTLTSSEKIFIVTTVSHKMSTNTIRASIDPYVSKLLGQTPALPLSHTQTRPKW